MPEPDGYPCMCRQTSGCQVSWPVPDTDALEFHMATDHTAAELAVVIRKRVEVELADAILEVISDLAGQRLREQAKLN